MESCFGSPKTELVHEACYKTRDAARRDLFAYIEGYDNRQRLHSALGYITPEQAERRAARSGVHDSGGRSFGNTIRKSDFAFRLSPGIFGEPASRGTHAREPTGEEGAARTHLVVPMERPDGRERRRGHEHGRLAQRGE